MLEPALQALTPVDRPRRLFQEGKARAVQVRDDGKRGTKGMPEITALRELDDTQAFLAVQRFEQPEPPPAGFQVANGKGEPPQAGDFAGIPVNVPPRTRTVDGDAVVLRAL